MLITDANYYFDECNQEMHDAFQIQDGGGFGLEIDGRRQPTTPPAKDGRGGPSLVEKCVEIS